MLACCPPYKLCTAGEMQKLSQVADFVPKVRSLFIEIVKVLPAPKLTGNWTLGVGECYIGCRRTTADYY